MKEAVIKLLRSSSNDDKVLGLELLVDLVENYSEFWAIVRDNMEPSEPKDTCGMTIDWSAYYEKSKNERK